VQAIFYLDAPPFPKEYLSWKVSRILPFALLKVVLKTKLVVEQQWNDTGSVKLKQ
jgi:hypothetical protein